MAQRVPHFCPRCGAQLQAQQQTCANCGYNVITRTFINRSVPGIASDEQYVQQPQPVVSQAAWQAAPTQTAPVQSQYVPPLQAPRKKSVGRIGCVVVLLLLLAALGSGLYFGSPLLGVHPPFFGAAMQPPMTTVSLNTPVTYAGLAVTLVKVQQSQSFVDDSTTSTTGVVRLQVSAHNTTKVPINLFYSKIAELVLPGGKVLTPGYVNADVGLQPDVTRTSIIDFALPTSTGVDQLVFRLGAANEAQLDIPLTVNPDLTKYQPKTTNLNEQLQYLGLNWTIVNATTQWSIDGQQAGKDMRYVTLQLKVDNPLTQSAITGSAYDYVRLKTATTTFTPVASTLAVSFPAGTTGQTGTVTFQIPRNTGTLAFLLVAPVQSGFKQATTNIQLS